MATQRSVELAGGVAGAAEEDGLATVSASVQACAERVWEALTEPRFVCQWFGELSAPLREGRANRLDFGDGDYFSIQDVGLDPYNEVRYRWRFLGMGPLDSVTWRIRTRQDGCLVTVSDREPRRSPQWNEELREGWTDFTQRLVSYLATGKPARYGWRREADGGIELPRDARGVWATLFAREALPAWLPCGGALEAGERWPREQGETFAPLEVGQVDWQEMSVGFELKHRRWARPTQARLQVVPRGDGAMLSFSHGGWEAISPKDAYCREARKRFCGVWVASLQRARKLIA